MQHICDLGFELPLPYAILVHDVQAVYGRRAGEREPKRRTSRWASPEKSSE
jgi:hypothetical protein